MWTARAGMPSQAHLELSAPRSIGRLPAAQLYLVPGARVTDHVAAVGGVAAEESTDGRDALLCVSVKGTTSMCAARPGSRARARLRGRIGALDAPERALSSKP